MNILDDKLDNRIRAALRKADEKGQLDVIAAVTGIYGGEQDLRKIMNSRDALSVMDRVLLGAHLVGVRND